MNLTRPFAPLKREDKEHLNHLMEVARGNLEDQLPLGHLDPERMNGHRLELHNASNMAWQLISEGYDARPYISLITELYLQKRRYHGKR